MTVAKTIKLVQIPLTLQNELEVIKGKYGVTHTAVIAHGIELAASEIKQLGGYEAVRGLYSSADAKRIEAVA